MVDANMVVASSQQASSQKVDIEMPQLGESVVEGTIVQWFKQVGETIAVDEILFEVSTDKVDTEVPSPAAGVIAEILADEGDVVEVGQILARLDTTSDSTLASDLPAQSSAQPSSPDQSAQLSTQSFAQPSVQSSNPGQLAGQVAEMPSVGVPDAGGVSDSTGSFSGNGSGADMSTADDRTAVGVASAQVTRESVAGILLSPIVRQLIVKNNLDPNTLQGTGLGGRITRSDVEKAIQARAGGSAKPVPPPVAPVASPPVAPVGSAKPVPPPVAPVASPPVAPVGSAAPAAPRPSQSSLVPVASIPAGQSSRVVPLSNIRKRTAEHMVMSKRVAPHVLTAIEVDYESVDKVRRPIRKAWKAEEGFSLTYLPFIIRAVVDALREFPYVNASFENDELIVQRAVNLAVAVDINYEGLLAPVIHNVEGKRLRQIARDVVDIATRARNRKLVPDDLVSGTFTITNAGSYGTLMQFPIINQPQVAILSTDGISRKPVVVTDSHGNEAIAIHSVGVLALAWDHRAFDGAYIAAFLHLVKKIIEERDWSVEVQ